MSKFLKIIENTSPEADLDAIIAAKRGLQKMLIGLGVAVTSRVFKDILYITLPDKRIVELEIKGVSSPKEEEEDDQVASQIKAITAIAGLPDQGFGKQIVSSTARKLQAARRNMAAAAEKISQNFLNAAK